MYKIVVSRTIEHFVLPNAARDILPRHRAHDFIQKKSEYTPSMIRVRKKPWGASSTAATPCGRRHALSKRDEANRPQEHVLIHFGEISVDRGQRRIDHPLGGP